LKRFLSKKEGPTDPAKGLNLLPLLPSGPGGIHSSEPAGVRPKLKDYNQFFPLFQN